MTRERRSTSRPKFLVPAIVTASLVVLLGGGYLGVRAVTEPQTAPFCIWPDTHFVGGTPSQRGVIGCYLEALAHRDYGRMNGVLPGAGQGDDAKVLPSAFRFSTSARSGPVEVTVKPNAVASDNAEVYFVFADGRTDSHELNVADPASETDWRFWDVDEIDRQ